VRRFALTALFLLAALGLRNGAAAEDDGFRSLFVVQVAT
jgi:hypothetical protein